jgi:methylglyoxal synthase
MTIAILAHDSRKELALQFCTAYSGILSRNTVIATGTTGRMLAQATGLPVHCYLSGKLGGIQQISARVACDEVDLVLFFRDPLKAETGRTCCGCAICTVCRSLPTSPPPKCCCAASTRATLTTVRASIPTS